MLLQIDGIDFSNLVLPMSFAESFETIAQGTSGTLQNNSDYYEMIGTRFSHSLVLKKRTAATREQWEQLYDLLAAPVPSHTVTVPHGQGTLTYNAHITSGGRELIEQIGSVNIWGDVTINLIPTSPQREA